MNSRTSRPRSPIRAMTLTSDCGCCGRSCRAASTCRRPSRRRCPCAGPCRRSAGRRCARTPVERLVDAAALRAGAAARRSSGSARAAASSGPLPSIGRPRPSMTRPSSSAPTGTREAAAGARTTSLPGLMPRISPSGMSSTRSLAEADDLGLDRRLAAARVDVADLAEPAGDALGLDRRPTTCATGRCSGSGLARRRWRRGGRGRCGAPGSRARSRRPRCGVASVAGPAGSLGQHRLIGEGADRARDLLELRLDLGVDDAGAGVDHDAADVHVRVGHDLVDCARPRGGRGGRSSTARTAGSPPG